MNLMVIDSYPIVQGMGADQVQWISDNLDQLGQEWKIVLGHHPLFSYGQHGEEPSMIANLETIFIENDVDLYLCGHEHDMQHIKRENGPHYVIGGSAAKLRPSGSGPYSLFDASRHGFTYLRASPSLFEVYFVATDLNVLYSFVLEK